MRVRLLVLLLAVLVLPAPALAAPAPVDSQPAATAVSPAAAATSEATTAQPNVLVILTDDQPMALFNRTLHPAVFGRLVDQGMTFNRSYVNTPFCCPSRSQLYTGLSEEHTGVDTNVTDQNLSPRPAHILRRPTIMQALRDRGYRTMLSGKWLNAESCAPREDFDRFTCTTTYRKKSPVIVEGGTARTVSGYTTDVLARRLADHVRETPATTPFFAVYAPPSPHLPFDDDRYATLRAPLPTGANTDEATLTSGKPEYAREHSSSPSERAQWASMFRGASQATRGMDDDIGRLLDSLGSRLDNTMVVFTSDNGYQFGEHRYEGKLVPYEESVRVPLVVRYPPLVPTTRARSVSALAQTVDVTATIAAVTGLNWAAGDGRSLVPVLTGQASAVRDAALITQCGGTSAPCAPRWERRADGPFLNASPPSYAAVVTRTAKYVEYVTGERELYDLAADPAELRNLAGSASSATLQTDLAAKLKAQRAPRLDTTITSGPLGALRTRVGRFTYFAPSRSATYQCRLIRTGAPTPSWRSCGDQEELMGAVPDGTYRFEVRGVDAGSVDSTPAAREFSVASTGPAVRIDSAPPARTRNTSLTFGFSSPTATSFGCALHRLNEPRTFTNCTSPSMTYGPLAPGRWVFSVVGRDSGGAVTWPPAQALVDLDTAPPVLWSDPRVPEVTRSADLTIRLRANEPATMRCSLDGASAVACGSAGRASYAMTGLRAGAHKLAVRATDTLGNAATTTVSWSVSQAVPLVSIASGPPAETTSTTATFTLSGTDRQSSGRRLRYFRVTVDGGPAFLSWTTLHLEGLARGRHQVAVTAVDAAGNESSPASYSWRVT